MEADGWDVSDKNNTTVYVNGVRSFYSLRNDKMTTTEQLSPPNGESEENWSFANTKGVCGTTHLVAQYPILLSQQETDDCIFK